MAGRKPDGRRHEFWDQHSYATLEATAVKFLERNRIRDNYIEIGDLISEGWLRCLRYAKSANQKRNLPIHLYKHYWDALRRLRYDHPYSAHQLTFSPLPDDLLSHSYTQPDGLELTEFVLGLLDDIDLICDRLQGRSCAEIARSRDQTTETIAVKIRRARQKRRASRG